MKRLLSSACVAAGAFWAANGWAIVPIDTVADPKQGWGGKLGVAFSGKDGNTNEEDYNINALLRHREQDRVLMFSGDYSYAKSEGVKTTDQTFLHARWIQFDYFAPRVDWEFFVQYETDEFRDLSNRELIGSNVRWRTGREWESGKLDSTWGAGAFYEVEEAESTGDKEEALRGNLYLKSVWENTGRNPFTVYGQAYLQPKLDEFGDVRATATAGIEFGITDKVALAVEVESNYDSEPFPGVEKTDTVYAVKLSYSLD